MNVMQNAVLLNIKTYSVVHFCGFGFVPRMGHLQYVLFFGELQRTVFFVLLYLTDIQFYLRHFQMLQSLQIVRERL